MNNGLLEKLSYLWEELYGTSDGQLQLFLDELRHLKRTYFAHPPELDTTWYKDAVVYSTYVDLFKRDLNGVKKKLPYLQDLGITCLWLLPILESPMKDAGFDISNFDEIRGDLLGLPPDSSHEDKDRVFVDFLDEAHTRGIRLIFDIAINHTSIEHPWFREARRSKDSPKREYYIWSNTSDAYPQARLLMKGIHESNWTYDDVSGQYYFHRFFEIQPDLNYGNPEVLLEMTRMLIRWKIKGVDGFRADAVPFLWKEAGTSCESLPQTHTIVKFFRAALDYLQPGTLILAEACQPPTDVVAYFGDGDECQAAYHFPVMPRIFRALAEEKATAIEMVMDSAFTPVIPKSCQWFMFLRCHDELSLEMVTPEERTFIYQYYTRDPRWSYRQGEGISARLATLLGNDFRKIRLAYSIMLTLSGTPIIYYGDEFAKENDEPYYQEIFALTRYQDSRYFVRGRIHWDQVERALQNSDTLAYQVYHALKAMIGVRKMHPAFSRGSLEFVHYPAAEGAVNPHILAYYRVSDTDRRFMIQNLSAQEQRIPIDDALKKSHDLLDQKLDVHNKCCILPPYSCYWL